MIITYLPRATVIDEICPLMLDFAEKNKPTESRQLALYMIGIVADFLGEALPNNMVNKCRALCLDQDKKVRLILISQTLEKIIKTIPEDMRQFRIMDKITELLHDNDIKADALRCLNQLITLFPKDVQSNQLTEMILRKMNIVEENIVLALSENFGDIINKLKPFLIEKEENLEKVMQYFAFLGQHENPGIRKNFIYNLPGFILITNLKEFDFLGQIYYDIYDTSEDDLRLCMVKSIHEILQIIGPQQSHKYLRDIVLDIIKSRNRQILKAFVNNLQAIFTSFSVGEAPQPEVKPGKKGKKEQKKER